MNEMQEKISTKEKILKAAFQLYKEPRWTDISLSEVAEIVGVSKTTIFRHFKNKEALLDAMQLKLVEIIEKIFNDFQNTNKREVIKNVVKFFTSSPEYIIYFMTCFVGPEDFEKKLGREFKRKGFSTKYKVYDDNMEMQNKDVYIEIIFAFTTLLFFILNFIKNGKNCENKEKYFDFVTSIYVDGLKSIKKINQRRIDELKSKIKTDEKNPLPEDKIFKAISEVLKAKGFFGVTLERVANKIGLAKSSLYTYFSNKNEMLKKLSLNEITKLLETVEKNTKDAKNFSEVLFIQMYTELNYFFNKKHLLPVFAWLCIQGAFNDLQDSKEEKIDINKISEDENILHGWCSVLLVGLLAQGEKNNFVKSDYDAAIMKMHNLMVHGFKL